MKIYISGGMRGYPQYNFPAFYAAERRLIDEGHKVINPARIDEAKGFDKNLPLEEQDFDLHETIRCDIDELLGCDAIYMLTGWWKSMGAFAELCVARWAGKKLLFQTRDKELVILKKLWKGHYHK